MGHCATAGAPFGGGESGVQGISPIGCVIDMSNPQPAQRLVAIPLLTFWATALLLFFFWQSFSYFGFVSWLAEWQFTRFGRYFPALTLTLLVLLCALPALLIHGYEQRRRGRSATAAHDVQHIAIATAIQWTRALFALALVGACATIASLVLMARLPDASGEVQHLSAASQAQPREGLTMLEGPLVAGLVARFDENLVAARRTIYFAPVTPAAGAPLRYFVEVRAPETRPTDLTVRHSGVLRHAALPSEIVSLYRNAGYTVSAEPLVLFSSEQAVRWRYLVVAIEFFLFAAICLGFALVQRRVWQRLRQAPLSD